MAMASHSAWAAISPARWRVARAVQPRDLRGGAVGQEVAERDGRAEHRAGERQRGELGRSEMADDRGVDEQVERLGGQRAEGGDREPEDLAVVGAAGPETTAMTPQPAHGVCRGLGSTSRPLYDGADEVPCRPRREPCARLRGVYEGRATIAQRLHRHRPRRLRARADRRAGCGRAVGRDADLDLPASACAPTPTCRTWARPSMRWPRSWRAGRARTETHAPRCASGFSPPRSRAGQRTPTGSRPSWRGASRRRGRASASARRPWRARWTRDSPRGRRADAEPHARPRAPSGWRSARLRLWHAQDGARIAYREVGTGPPLVLVHSAGLSHREFEPAVEDLAHRFRLILPDLPAHGDSEDRPRHPYTLRLAGRRARGVLRRRRRAPTAGGRPRARRRSAHPRDRVGAVARQGGSCCCRAACIGRPSAPKPMARGSARHGRRGCRVLTAWPDTRCGSRSGPSAGTALTARGVPEAADLVRHAMADVGGNANLARSWARLARELPRSARREVLDLLPQLDVPVLLLWADEDRHHPLRGAEEALDLLPDAILRVLPRNGLPDCLRRPGRRGARAALVLVVGELRRVSGDRARGPRRRL